MYAIILAGGSGSRLWPLSRELYPKQLLNLNHDKSLLQDTFARLNSFIEAKNIVSTTNTKHVANVKRQLQEIHSDVKVLSEPLGRNTAPAIAVATKFILQNGADDVVLVVPSDHLITDTDKFKSTVQKGAELAQKGYIVTFGIQPTYPETGYGYININSDFTVNKFVEKPNLETAKQYLKEGNYFWNSGIFMFKASVMLDEIKKCSPEIFENLNNFDFIKSAFAS